MIVKNMTLNELADILDAAAEPNQGLSYHNGKPQKRYDTITGEPYFTRDATEFRLTGPRADNFYTILLNAKALAAKIREARLQLDGGRDA